MSDKHGRSPTLLFCSAGRRVELLLAFRRAYESLGLESRIIALDIDPLAPALQVADRHYIVPRLTEPAYVPTLVDICAREHVDLVFPLIDPDIPVLAMHRREIESTGARVATVCTTAAEVTADKWRTKQFFASVGLATPRSWLPEEIDPAHACYPLFIKPRCGSAGKDTYRVRNERELEFFLDYVPYPIIEEFLPGPEMTSDVVCDVEGNVLAVVTRQRIEVRSGEVVKGVTIHNETILDACIGIARALPAIGPITVQCMAKDGRFHFTEINARFGGGFPLGVAAGADSPRWLLGQMAGIPVDLPPLGTYQAGCYLTRFDNSYVLNEAEREHMASCHLRSR